MALQKLSDPMAFANGAELWLLPNAQHSQWARKIDWYLNFQAARASMHQAPSLVSGLLEMLKEEQLGTPTTSADSQKPLMISTSHRLPARYTVQLQYQGKLKVWLKQVSDVWIQIGQPNSRLFLPTGASFNDCIAAWEPESRNVSVVTDYDHQKTTGV